MNKIQKYKGESIVYLLLITVALATNLYLFGDKLYAKMIAIEWTMGVLLFLFFYGIISIFVISKKIQTASSRQVVSLYMLLKGGKIFIFLSIVMTYALAIKVETKRFVLLAVALYFIYLLLDTLFLTKVEKKLKNEKSKENE